MKGQYDGRIEELSKEKESSRFIYIQCITALQILRGTADVDGAIEEMKSENRSNSTEKSVREEKTQPLGLKYVCDALY